MWHRCLTPSLAALAAQVLSRAAALAILRFSRESPDCDPNHQKWADRIHQGGDAWLGDCAEAAGVQTDMEYGSGPHEMHAHTVHLPLGAPLSACTLCGTRYGFYPQPPVANLFHLFTDAVAYHGD